MKRHAKASSAGSNSEPSSGLAPTRRGILALFCLALALGTALAATPAMAALTHPYTGASFGPDGTTATSFNNVVSAAVDAANGNVYVEDWGAGKLYKFDSAGSPVTFSQSGTNAIEVPGGCCFPGENQVAVAPPGSPGGTAGDIYVANGAAALIYAPSGEQIGELSPGGETCGVATNPAGHVFVGTYPETIREYIPSGNPVTLADEEGVSSAELPEICNVGADGLGNVYAAFYGGEAHGAVRLEGLEAASATEFDPHGHTLAVDPVSNDVYADRGSSVAQYGPSGGSPISVFGADRLTASRGIAVNGASGDIYVSNGGSHHVDVFGPPIVVPTVIAQAASAIMPAKAVLNALVNPEGIAVTNCKFEYGTSASYGESVPCEGAIPPDSSDHPVTAAIVGLKAETTYHFRIVASNANGSSESDDQTFKTGNAALTGEATAVTGTKATLNGIVFPEGEAVSECFFEYGTTTSYGKTALCEGSTPPDEGEHPVSATLTHLLPNGTTYHFRLVIKRAGIIQGVDRSFETAETVITGSASASNSSTATIEGSVNPEGMPQTECKFEYGPTNAYGLSETCAESPAAIGEGTSPVSVHADLNGLTPGGTYHYRLVATNADGTANGKDRSFGPPLIESQQTHGVVETEAELVVRVTPNGLPTTYHLEYGTDASYGQSTPDGDAGSDENKHTLATRLEALAPGTTYHWRAVATNPHGVSKGPDRTFTTFAVSSPDTSCPNQGMRTGASAGLPDCRAYEMVSPPRKVGEVLTPERGGLLGGSCGECLPGINDGVMPMQSAADGEAVVYEGQPFSGGMASGPNEYLSRRTTGGWGTQSLSTRFFQGAEGQGYSAFSSDLSRGVLYQIEPALSPAAPMSEGESFANLYPWQEGVLQPLVDEEPPHRSPGRLAGDRFRITYGGANSGIASTPAFGHVIFAANDALTEASAFAPEAPEVDPDNCAELGADCNLYEWSDGDLRLINVLPGNTGAASGAVIGSGLLQAEFPNTEFPTVDHAISADGERIFWSASNGQVYVRIDGKETQKIEDTGMFLTASPDGSRLLLSDGCLYSLQAEACEDDLSQGEGGFEGILGAAEDLSRVYFVDTAVLTGGEENANEERAEVGEFNLYAWHQGAAAFIGQLLPVDNRVHLQFPGFGGDWKATRSSRTAQVSPDGRYLVFMSRARLTGYDNEAKGGECGLHEAPNCRQIFEYDAASANLACASCNPANEQPLGGSNLSLLAQSPEAPPFLPPKNLTADGQGRLFFESQDALSSRDLNGNVQDVYRWDPNGAGGCERTGGCVSLISSGQSANDSMFVDATPTGNDVFFITREQLLLRDRDDLLDLYDARVGGGFNENVAPPCLGEACKGPGTTAPAQQSPGSSSFSGPGNEKPRKAKKHKKKRRKHAHKHESQKRSAKHNSGGSK